MGRKRRGPPESETPDPNGRRRPSSSSNPNSNPNPPPETLISQNPPISTPNPRRQLSSAFFPPTAHHTPPIVASIRQPERQPQPPIPQQQQQQHVKLFGADGSSADGRSLFVDLHPESQRLMLQVHDQIQQYKGESALIDQSSRLSDTPGDYFGLEAARICQELREFSSIAETKTIEMQKLMPAVRDLMSVVEIAVNSFWRSKQMLLCTNASNYYRALPVRPTPFLQNTVRRFEDELEECCDWIDKHERLICLNTRGPHSSSSSLQAIKETMSNNYARILHLADKVEKLHQTMESIKKSFLLYRHQQGQESNPFLEADRREAARQGSASRRVHPTIHLSSVGVQPFTAAGSFPSSTMLQQSVGSSVFSYDGWHQALSTPSPSVSAPDSPYFPPCNPTPVMNFVLPSTSQFGSTTNPTIYGALSTIPSTSGAAGGSGSGSSRTPTRSSSKHRHNRRNQH